MNRTPAQQRIARSIAIRRSIANRARLVEIQLRMNDGSIIHDGDEDFSMLITGATLTVDGPKDLPVYVSRALTCEIDMCDPEMELPVSGMARVVNGRYVLESISYPAFQA